MDSIESEVSEQGTGPNTPISSHQCHELIEISSNDPQPSIPPTLTVNQKNETSEMAPAEIITIKPSDSTMMRSSSSYVIETKLNKKKNLSVEARQMQATAKFLDRPKTARERQNSRKDSHPMVVPHKLGSMPAYLQRRKTKTSTSTSVETLSPLFDSSASLNQQEAAVMHDEEKLIVKATDASEVEEMRMKIAEQLKTISSDKTQILALRNRTTVLEKQQQELQVALEKTKEELRSSTEQNKALDRSIAKLHKEQKSLSANKERLEQLEITIANLSRQKDELSAEMTKKMREKNDELEKLRSRVEKLSHELKMQRSTVETLTNEKNNLQAMLNCTQGGEKREDGDKRMLEQNDHLFDKIAELKKQLESKSHEVVRAKEDKRLLAEEVEKMKSKLSESPSSLTADDKVKALKDKLLLTKAREEELVKKILSLESKVENQKCDKERKDKLLDIRADHIKALQDAENILKARIMFQLKEIEELRDRNKGFEKFMLAYEEEKQNFQNTFKLKS